MNSEGSRDITVAELRREMTGLGRREIEDRLVASIDGERLTKFRNAELASTISTLQMQNSALTENVTHLQIKANGALTSHRLAKVLEQEPLLMVAMLDLAWGIDTARTKHPEGSDLTSLVSEVGEVAKAMYAESAARTRDELLDVAIVAMRLILGEVKHREVTFASGPDARASGADQ